MKTQGLSRRRFLKGATAAVAASTGGRNFGTITIAHAPQNGMRISTRSILLGGRAQAIHASVSCLCHSGSNAANAPASITAAATTTTARKQVYRLGRIPGEFMVFTV